MLQVNQIFILVHAIHYLTNVFFADSVDSKLDRFNAIEEQETPDKDYQDKANLLRYKKYIKNLNTD